MKPLRASDLTYAAPLDGRGQRKPADVLSRASRDHLLRLAAERHCRGMSDRQAAEMIRTRLARYRSCAWRRDQTEDLCPARWQGRIEQLLWEVLRVRDMVPSARSIRRALGFTWPTL
jgi:hypothetical protein